jgi:outer membrane protein assembly factor BamB
MMLGLLGAGLTACGSETDAGDSRVAWTTHYLWGGLSGQAILAEAGSVYATFSGEIAAFDAASGRRQWTFQPEKGEAQSSAPVLDGGAVYLATGPVAGGTARHKLYAVDAKTGSQRWLFTTAPVEGAAMSPAVSGAMVYLSAGGILYALDAATGRQRWSWRRGQFLAPFGPPVFAHGRVYAGNLAGVVYAFHAGTGRRQWSVKCGNDFTSTAFSSRPLVTRDVLYIAGQGGLAELYALNATTGEQKWKFNPAAPAAPNSGRAHSPVAVGSTLCLVSSTDGRKVYGLDRATGARRWQFTGPWKTVPEPPALGHGMLLVSGDNNVLYGLDPATGAQRSRYPLIGNVVTAPATGSGFAYLATTTDNAATAIEGDLYAIRL